MKNFVTFEGGEGSGKSTVIQGLIDYCNQKNIDCIATREPGGLEVCEEIRRILKSTPGLSVETQLLLFSASRNHLCKNLIKPNLEQGKIVFCDRFYDSTRAYQGYAGGMSDDDIMLVTNYAVGDIKPQITFFLDIDPVVAFERKGGCDKGDVIEEAGIEYHKKVRKGYHLLAEKEKDRFVVIDATLPKEEVLNQIITVLKDRGVL